MIFANGPGVILSAMVLPKLNPTSKKYGKMPLYTKLLFCNLHPKKTVESARNVISLHPSEERKNSPGILHQQV